MYKMTSSLRVRSLDETFQIASLVAKKRGISRLTSTTWLDNIGIPVYASIRPNAHPDTLCVHNGKGSKDMEAKVGALMEAIEFSYAEFGNNDVHTEEISIDFFLKQKNFDFEWLDFSPLFPPVPINGNEKILATKISSFDRKYEHYIPAELIFSPIGKDYLYERFFGTSTNGLASGNSYEEAVFHGLLEIIERDVRSFEKILHGSMLVNIDTVTPEVLDMVDKINAAGYQLYTRYVKSKWNIPYFESYIVEKNSNSPIAISYGAGAHVDKNIALVRSISEAAQSRLTHIHGGRDDIIKIHDHFSDIGKKQRSLDIDSIKKKISENSKVINFTSIAQNIESSGNISELLSWLVSHTENYLDSKVYAIQISPDNLDLSVVRVVVPKAEFYSYDFPRIGKRLMKSIVELNKKINDE